MTISATARRRGPVTMYSTASAMSSVERAFAAAHGYATLWRSGLYADRQATTDDVAREAAGITRILARTIPR